MAGKKHDKVGLLPPQYPITKKLKELKAEAHKADISEKGKAYREAHKAHYRTRQYRNYLKHLSELQKRLAKRGLGNTFIPMAML